VGRLLVKCDEKMSPIGMACTKSTESMSEAMKGVLSWSQLGMWWKLHVQDVLLVLELVLLLLLRIEPALISKLLLPRSYTSMPLSLLLKSLGLPGPEWLLRLRLLLSCLEASLVLTLLLLRSCMLLLKSLESNVQLRLLLLSSLLLVLLSLLCAASPLMLPSGVLWSFWGTCTCSGFIVGVASPIITLEISACSCIWWLFGLVSVASD